MFSRALVYAVVNLSLTPRIADIFCFAKVLCSTLLLVYKINCFFFNIDILTFLHSLNKLNNFPVHSLGVLYLYLFVLFVLF